MFHQRQFGKLIPKHIYTRFEKENVELLLSNIFTLKEQ